MNDLLEKILRPQWHGLEEEPEEHLNPYLTFLNYRKIWTIGITVLLSSALLPLIVITIIYYQLMETSMNTESLLRANQLTSNTRRAVTYFLEERLAALTFTVNEVGYDRLSDPQHLTIVLTNLKLGFGGLTDLSVIASTGAEVAYAGPFNLKGKDYSNQPWFLECQQQNAYISDVFSGYRDVPHIVVAVKSLRKDGTYFILRATIDTERLIQTIKSYKTGAHADIFLINRKGALQTPSRHQSDYLKSINMAALDYSARTQTIMAKDRSGRPVVVGYAFIDTKIAPSPFILMVVKQRAGLMKVWLEMRSHINWFFALSAVILAIVIVLTSTFMVNKIFTADHARAKTLALAEQSSQMASIGQLAAGVAHEINNPLALINETAGYIKDLFEIKAKYQEDEELMEYIDSILDAVSRCGAITRQLLGFARRFEIRIQPIDLKELVLDVLNFHRKEAEYRNISINIDMPETLPLIESDRGKLQQVLLNLINNAFQAVDSGCFLGIHAEKGEGDQIFLTIQDDGCGIPEENINNVFDPFFTTKKEGEGTGLGLSITYGLVKKLHGNITVKSVAGAGTTFIVSLPIRLSEKTG